jgi:hypothetical protein
VEASLYRRAIGYTVSEEKMFYNSKGGYVHKEESVKHYPPDTTAAIFWLKNRNPKMWRDAMQAPEPSPTAPVAKKSFEQFMIDGGYPRPYPKQIEMAMWYLEQFDPRLLLGSRGYGKTDYVTIGGTAYGIYLDPMNDTTMLVTKSKERNKAIVNEIATLCTKNGVQFEIQNSNTLRAKGMQGKQDSLIALTLGSSGFRGNHQKRTIMDDPITPEDESEATRKQVKRLYNELNKLTKNICIVGQPVHKFDLYQELRPLLKKLEVPYGSIPELDPDLIAMALAGVDQRSIEASYHLRIISDGSVPFEKIRYIDKFPTVETSVAFIDPSHEGGDYTALSIFHAYGDGLAVVGFCYKKSWNHCLDEMLPLFKKFNVRKLAIETNGLGDMPVDMLGQAFPHVQVTGRRSNTNKHSRIMAASGYAHMIHLSKESDRTYTNQVVQYEYKSEHDDAPDSLATGMQWIGLIRGKENIE